MSHCNQSDCVHKINSFASGYNIRVALYDYSFIVVCKKR